MGIIRVLLAIAVVIAHSSAIFGISSVGGQIAVEAFYIISGFYMSLILNEKYILKNGSFKLFISNRLLRLFPVYWCILLLTILFALVLGLHSKGAYWGSLQAYADFLPQLNWSSFFLLGFTNLFIVFQDLLMFLGLDSQGHFFFTSNFINTNPQVHTFLLIPQAWTVGLEILFYLIAPFILRKKLGLILTLLLLSLAVRFILFRQGLTNDPWSYRFFPKELFYFLLGNLSYRIYKWIELKNIKGSILNCIWIFMIGLTIFYSKIEIPQQDNLYFLLFFISLPFIFLLTKNNKMDAYIGELSYPI